VRMLPVPVIAAIDGWCLGLGVEFAAACDIRLATHHSKFAMPEVKIGIPSVVHAAMLPRQIGAARTRWWLLTGRTINADEALSWGLLNEVVDPTELDERVESTVQSILECPPQALRTQKALCNEWEEKPLSEAIELTIEPFGEAFATGEPTVAMRAFLERKRNA
jgi:enoyl-CoA hydratase